MVLFRLWYVDMRRKSKRKKPVSKAPPPPACHIQQEGERERKKTPCMIATKTDSISHRKRLYFVCTYACKWRGFCFWRKLARFFEKEKAAVVGWYVSM